MASRNTRQPLRTARPASIARSKSSVRQFVDQIRFEPAVPPEEVVARANEADVGLFHLPDHSRQARHALPNKLFEYIMAGLAVCVSDLPEMSPIVRRHGTGLLIDGSSPAAIAGTVNRFTPASIDRFKRRSLVAARELCWEVEQQHLVDAFARSV
jgi:glycosyltransferase involved in cell wall biosynthesis